MAGTGNPDESPGVCAAGSGAVGGRGCERRVRSAGNAWPRAGSSRGERPPSTPESSTAGHDRNGCRPPPAHGSGHSGRVGEGAPSPLPLSHKGLERVCDSGDTSPRVVLALEPPSSVETLGRLRFFTSRPFYPEGACDSRGGSHRDSAPAAGRSAETGKRRGEAGYSMSLRPGRGTGAGYACGWVLRGERQNDAGSDRRSHFDPRTRIVGLRGPICPFGSAELSLTAFGTFNWRIVRATRNSRGDSFVPPS